MKPILNGKPGSSQANAWRRATALLLALFPVLVAARADTTNFVGDFNAAFWTNAPAMFGGAFFTNSSTELVLTGPNAPATEQSSLDGILYNGPLEGGLVVGGTVEFNWSYDSGDALSSSEADFAWTPPGGGTPVQQLLAQGGPGVITSGSFTTPLLAAGTTFQFLLTTDTLANKTSGTLVISDFVFRPDVPEPASGSLMMAAALCFAAARLRNRLKS